MSESMVEQSRLDALIVQLRALGFIEGRPTNDDERAARRLLAFIDTALGEQS